VFNYGKHLLFDITVPEPAALILDAATIQSQTQLPQEPPTNFTLTPAELGVHAGDKNYHVIQCGVEGLSSPPLDNTTVAKTLILSRGDKAMNKRAELAISNGYRAISVRVGGQYNYTEQNNNGLWVGFHWRKQDWGWCEVQHLFCQIHTYGSRRMEYGILIQIFCEPLKAKWETWRLDTHRKIISAW
jgi:hypothetical protein